MTNIQNLNFSIMGYGLVIGYYLEFVIWLLELNLEGV